MKGLYPKINNKEEEELTEFDMYINERKKKKFDSNFSKVNNDISKKDEESKINKITKLI
jgi:hypothetical protein